jgi:hypothetical protein
VRWGRGTYKFEGGVVLVDNSIIDGMEVVGLLFVRKMDWVTTSISNGEVGVNSAGGVEGLMDVSNVMDEQSQGIWSAEGFGVNVTHNLFVGVGVLVVAGVAEPVGDLGDHKGDVLDVEYKVRVVWDTWTVINEGSINEVPFWLPATAGWLDIVSKCGTLNERVVWFFHGEFGITINESL